ncbi:hypothetical protein G6F31_019907 [Rhizopus arrhizus]|nr:hypothetical protein G6F31_019907 [Rhizopus arrhizus]
MARTHVLAVDADQRRQLAPEFVRALRQRHLLDPAALAAHTAVVHAAGACAAQPGFQQHDGHALAAQEQRRAAADDAPADDGDFGIDTLRHDGTFSRRSRHTTRTGTGLTGGWLRRRPTSAAPSSGSVPARPCR